MGIILDLVLMVSGVQMLAIAQRSVVNNAGASYSPAINPCRMLYHSTHFLSAELGDFFLASGNAHEKLYELYGVDPASAP